jgi:predicted transcriptional regulator
MEDYLKAALEIANAQASVKTMTVEDITTLVQGLTKGIQAMDTGATPEVVSAPAPDAKKSIKENSVTRLECGKVFKLLTQKHLATHGLDAAAYREKWGLKRGTSLVAHGLRRARKKKMASMKLWERRGAAKRS